MSKLSRQMKRRPGASQRTANANARGLGRLPTEREGDGATNSSSEAGASVARIRAPETISPASVSSTTRSATSPPACSSGSTARFTCGAISVWVRQRSRSRSSS